LPVHLLQVTFVAPSHSSTLDHHRRQRLDYTIGRNVRPTIGRMAAYADLCVTCRRSFGSCGETGGAGTPTFALGETGPESACATVALQHT
jgi:hypothetical protein